MSLPAAMYLTRRTLPSDLGVLADDGRGDQDDADLRILGHFDHFFDVELVLGEDFRVSRLIQPMPHIVDTDADGHDGRLLVDHVLLETLDQVLGFLAADAGVDDRRELEVRVLLGKDGVHGPQVAAGWVMLSPMATIWSPGLSFKASSAGWPAGWDGGGGWHRSPGGNTIADRYAGLRRSSEASSKHHANASAPATMSSNSSVICDCRARLYC